MKDKFIIEHFIKDGKHFLRFIPAIKCEGYKPKEVEVTEGQWHELRYHFALGINDQENKEKICYVP